MLVSGGEVNTERAAVMVVDEFRASKWGRITLEAPPAERESRMNSPLYEFDDRVRAAHGVFCGVDGQDGPLCGPVCCAAVI